MPSKFRERRLYLDVIEQYSKGKSYRQIASDLKVSTWKVGRILSNINQQTKEELELITLNEIPLAFRSHIITLRAIMVESDRILHSTTDPRVKLLCLQQIKDCSHEVGLTLSDSSTVARAVEAMTPTPTALTHPLSTDTTERDNRHRRNGRKTIYQDREPRAEAIAEADKTETQQGVSDTS